MSGALTPRPLSTPTAFQPQPLPDTTQIREVLATMKNTLATLSETFGALQEQSARVATLGPSQQDASKQIQILRRQMRAQDKKHDARINEVKHLVRDVLKDQIAEHMKAQIAEQIRAEIAIQVKEQMAEQVLEQLPIPLAEQAEDSKRQLIEVRHSLVNSEARRANSVLRGSNLDDPLTVIVRSDGTKSELFPSDLRTLFAYDTERAKNLVKDYGLPEHELREKNLNRFMSHIGIPFQLVPVPIQMETAEVTNALGIMTS